MNFEDLILLPEARRLVIGEHKPAIEVESLTWTATGGGSYYATITAGEIIEVFENGVAYSEVFTAGECDAAASTFFLDFPHTYTPPVPVGLGIPDMGAYEYQGVIPHVGVPDIGAYEYQGETEDVTEQRLYLHTSNGDSPANQTDGLYDFCILAYFIIGFADRVDADGCYPIFEPEIETLLDGGFEDWTSSTVLTKWSKVET